MGKQKVTNKAIDAVRAVAAIIVVMEHVRALGFQDWAQVAHTPLNAAFYFVTGLGSSAVMVFFVLSGFLVGGSVVTRTRSGTFSWGAYLLQRVARLWVVLIPAIILALAIGWLLVAALPLTDVVQGDAAYHNVVKPDLASTLGPVTAAGNLFFLQGIVVPVIGMNGPLWSLAYEFWYYIFFPLLAVAFFRGRVWKRTLSGLLAALTAFFVGPHIMGLFVVWSFGVGVAVYAVPIAAALRRSRARARVARWVAGAVMIGSLLMRESGSLPDFVGQMVVGMAAAILLSAFVTDVSMVGWRMAPARWLAAGAKSSYSLYVIHLPLAILCAALLMPWSTTRFVPDPLSVGGFLLVTALLVAAGWLFARATEAHTAAFRNALAYLIRAISPFGRQSSRTKQEGCDAAALLSARSGAD